MHRRTLPALVVIASSLVVTGCGGADKAETKTPASAPSAPSGKTATPSIPGTTEKITRLERSKVREAIDRGLGVLLQNVSVEDWPVMRDGKFYGFRVRALNPEWVVDLKPGDVLLRVNGMPIEHPEDADRALRSLDRAPSLRIDYERDGKVSVLEIPIVDDGGVVTAGAQGKRVR
ncbi:MAG: hypothetical protein FWD69_03155 [Polyangiaceae bacterium]|nr:hypothetical protein [Polyangiaceae bacterium]